MYKIEGKSIRLVSRTSTNLIIYIYSTNCWTENSPRKAQSLSDMRINPSESTVAHFPPTPKVSPLNPSVVMRKLTFFKSMTARAAAMKSPDNIKSLWSISDLPWCSRQWCWEDYHPPDDKTRYQLWSTKPSLLDWYDRFGIDDFIYSALADSRVLEKRQCEYDDTTKCTFTSVFDKTHIKSALTVLDTFERNVAIVNGTALPSHSSVAQSHKAMTD